MSDLSRKAQKGDHFAFYMDLLGHDVLNSNQAVLSYLELIAASSSLDKNAKVLAEKAVSHIRTSTILIDNVKRLIAARNIDVERLKPTDLVKSVERAEMELRGYFPARKILLDKSAMPKSAFVLGNNHAADLVLNVFITAVRLDPSDDVVLRVKVAEDTYERRPAWVLRLEDKNLRLPPFLDGKDILAIYSRDVSTAAKSTGILFAKMLAGSLGGDFRTNSLYHDERKNGAVFTVILRRAGRP